MSGGAAARGMSHNSLDEEIRANEKITNYGVYDKIGEGDFNQVFRLFIYKCGMLGVSVCFSGPADPPRI